MGPRLGVSSGQETIEARIDDELSRLITQFTNEITWYMHERNLTRADLAGLMGVSPGRVSQVLSGGENLTLRTLAGLATALGAQFEVELSPRQPAAGGDGTGTGHDVMRTQNPVVEDLPPLRQAGGFDAAASRRR